MLDINAPEFLVLLVLAVVIFGPEKLPDLARKAARVLNYVRNIANDAQGKLRNELGPEFADLNLADLNPKALVTSTLLDPVTKEVQQVRSTVSEAVAELEAAPQAEDDAVVEVAERVPVPFDAEAT